MNKKALAALFFVLVPLAVRSQTYFDHMDVGVTAGSTGVGFSLKMPAGSWLDVRTGFTFLPHLNLNSSYSIVVGGEKESTGSLNPTKIGQMVQFLNDLTGYSVDDEVVMTKQTIMWNYKLLFDVKPFRNYRDFHFTAGVFAGPKKVGRAFNIAEEAPTLTAVGLYNSLYGKICREEPLFSSGTGLPEVTLDPEIGDRMVGMGMMGARLGTFSDGDDAVVVPDENGMLKARMVSGWSVRPYIGAGWNKSFCQGKLGVGVDVGCFFWGGSSKLLVDNVYKTNFKENGYDLVSWKWVNNTTGELVTTGPSNAYRPQATEGKFKRLTDAEGNPVFGIAEPQTIDMCSDIDVTRSDIGGLVNLVQKLHVYPVLTITISHRLF